MKPVSPEELVRRRRFRVRLYQSLCALGVVLLAMWGISPWYKLSWNMNHSLDGYLYVIEKNARVVRGEIFAFTPPRNPFYDHTWFVKYAAAVPGDVIVVKNREYYLDDKYLGRAKDHSLGGIPLNASLEDGTHIIHEGEYFCWTPHEDSFDSRYKDIGLIKENTVLGRAYRIF